MNLLYYKHWKDKQKYFYVDMDLLRFLNIFQYIPYFVI